MIFLILSNVEIKRQGNQINPKNHFYWFANEAFDDAWKKDWKDKAVLKARVSEEIEKLLILRINYWFCHLNY